MNINFNKGDRVIYIHSLNSKSKVIRKHATFLRKKTYEIAVIKCDKNKNNSYVPIESISMLNNEKI